MLCAISMTVPPWLMITKHDNKIHSMPSLWLLPFVSTVVASALAGLCVEIKIYGAPRHRRDACSMAWRCRLLTARRNQHGLVITEK